MKKTTVYIIEKEANLANLIKYKLLSHKVNQVNLFPNIAECLHFMQKKSADFLIIDTTNLEYTVPDILKVFLRMFPGIKLLFLSPVAEDSLAEQLIADGATDYIYKSGQSEEWICELVKNIQFLVREKSRVY
jgi:DNA-binding NtrC family response regulator